MKFYNKNPKLRDTWTQIVLCPAMPNSIVKLWAQRHPGTGRFYGKYDTWQFENEADALLFKLRWGYNTA